jgi:hypothetical protein
MSAWHRRQFLRSAVLGGAWALGRPTASSAREARDPRVQASNVPDERLRSWLLDNNGAVNLKDDFGAVGNGDTDDGPALQAAFDFLASAGGGTILVPPGRYAIRTPVSKDLKTASSVVIEGAGSSSQFLIATGAPPAISLSNLESIVFDDLTFVGTPGVLTDAGTILNLVFCLQATLRRVDFYGLSSTLVNGAIVRAHTTDLRIQGCAFRGCTASAFNSGAVVLNLNWMGLSITDTDFIDFGSLNGVYHSKTPLAFPLAWVLLRDTSALNNVFDQNTAVLRGVRMDEGAKYGFACLPDPAVSGRVGGVLLSDLRVNVSSVTGGAGCWIQHVDNVRIEHSWFGFAPSPRDAIHVREVGDAVVDGVLCDAGANAITAEASVNALYVRESRYGRLLSDAGVTTVSRGGVDAFLVRADGAIAAQSLVVQSPLTDGRVVIAPAGASAASIVGVALDASLNAGDYVRVLRVPGFAVSLKSDGAGPITRGASVAPSPTHPGRIRADASRPGPHIGRSLTTVAASDSATAQVLFTLAQ